MITDLAKSYLSPRADRYSTRQLEFLLLNFPIVLIFNDYKSNLTDLSNLGKYINLYNGFTYQPNKNIKTRAFKGLKMGFFPVMLNGLVVLGFFKSAADFNSFENFFEQKNFTSISLFSLIINGHLVSTTTYSRRLNNPIFNFSVNQFSCSLIKKICILPKVVLKINDILNAYVKSVN